MLIKVKVGWRCVGKALCCARSLISELPRKVFNFGYKVSEDVFYKNEIDFASNRA